MSMRPSMTVLGTATVALLIVACGDDPVGLDRAAAVSLSRDTVGLTSIGDTARLSAHPLDQRGLPVEASVSWSVDDVSVATVDDDGLLMAVANGEARVTVTAGDATATAVVVVEQLAARMIAVGGDAQSGALFETLQPLVASVTDALGAAVGGGIDVTFVLSEGAGALNVNTVATDASGSASVVLTVDSVSGIHVVAVYLSLNPLTGTRFTALVQPDVPASTEIAAGDNQIAPTSSAVPVQPSVRLRDRFANPVPGVVVEFAVTSGGGALDQAGITTDNDGVAAATWTLGTTIGVQALTAHTTALPAEFVNFAATGVTLRIDGVDPAPIVEGATGVVVGEGFGANPVVQVEGQVATVLSGIDSRVEFSVPERACAPSEPVAVTVSAGGATSVPFLAPSEPANRLDLAVGEQRIVSDPNDFCLQLPAAMIAREYLVGLTLTAEDGTILRAFEITGRAGGGVPPLVTPVPPLRSSVPSSVPPPNIRQTLRALQDQEYAEDVIRRQEVEGFDGTSRALLSERAGAATARRDVPGVGERLSLRVPDIDRGSCQHFIATEGRVRAVSTHGILVTDEANPVSFSDAEMQQFASDFDAKIFGPVTSYFGEPTDLDGNGRIIIYYTQAVNRFLEGRVGGFVTSNNLRSRSDCPSSAEGEIFYAAAPDPDAKAGPNPRSKEGIVSRAPSLIAHEFTHVIQGSRRLILSGSSNPKRLTVWETEGGARFAQEIVGHGFNGNQIGQNYRSDVALNGPFYTGSFFNMGTFFGGHATQTNTLPVRGAPALCTVFGRIFPPLEPVEPCFIYGITYFYGPSWSFQRYVADRFGPTYPGGEQGLMRDWVDANPTIVGSENVAALLGMSFDSLFVQWSTALWTDDRVSGLAPALTFASWNVPAVMDGLGSAVGAGDGLSLRPLQYVYGDFATPRVVRAGSTAYGLISAPGAVPALSLRVLDLDGQTLTDEGRPHLWIVRTQ